MSETRCARCCAEAYDAARRTTINAHYNDPGIATAMWQAVRAPKLHRGCVLEPGCGAGIVLGTAPEGARLTVVELDPTTASIAAPGPRHVARRPPPVTACVRVPADRDVYPFPPLSVAGDQQVSPTDS
jgi:hypothetical protein